MKRIFAKSAKSLFCGKLHQRGDRKQADEQRKPFQRFPDDRKDLTDWAILAGAIVIRFRKDEQVGKEHNENEQQRKDDRQRFSRFHNALPPF